MNRLFLTITIDTENPQNALLKDVYHTDTLLLPERGHYGPRYLLRMFEEYHIRASWFLNVYEEYWCGDRIIGRLCELLRAHGQDIQLHTHPVWLMDKERRKKIFMSQYSLEEQIFILEKGREEIYRLSGMYPTAHRGGGYGVNDSTLQALARTPMKVDASLLAVSPHCMLRSNHINAIHKLKGVLEFPVSCYQVWDYPKCLFHRGAPKYKSDLNYSSLQDLISCCEQMLKFGMPYLNIFMHSFSLYKLFYKDIDSPAVDFTPDRGTLRRFQGFLEYVSQKPEIEIVTVRELERRVDEGMIGLDQKDDIPAVRKINGRNLGLTWRI